MGPGNEPICWVSVIWPFHSAELLGLLASEPPPMIFRPGHIPLDHWLTLTYMSSGTMYRSGDEFFFVKIERYFGFHMAPTTEQPKGRCVWGLGLRSRAPGTCFAEKLVRRFVPPICWDSFADFFLGGVALIFTCCTRERVGATLKGPLELYPCRNRYWKKKYGCFERSAMRHLVQNDSECIS